MANTNKANTGTTEKATGVFVGGMIVGIAVGAAAGAITGLLAAPQRGKETRKLLKDSADELPELMEDVSDSVQFHSKRIVEAGLNNLDRNVLRLRRAIATGIEVSKKERDRFVQTQDTQTTASSEQNGQA